MDGAYHRLSWPFIFAHWSILWFVHVPTLNRWALLLHSSPEALNGRLPNQDLINSVERISRYTAGVPVTLYDHLDPREEPAADVTPHWLPQALYQIPEVKSYLYQARNVARHVRYQYHGRGSGVHGLFRK